MGFFERFRDPDCSGIVGVLQKRIDARPHEEACTFVIVELQPLYPLGIHLVGVEG